MCDSPDNDVGSDPQRHACCLRAMHRMPPMLSASFSGNHRALRFLRLELVEGAHPVKYGEAFQHANACEDRVIFGIQPVLWVSMKAVLFFVAIIIDLTAAEQAWRRSLPPVPGTLRGCGLASSTAPRLRLAIFGSTRGVSLFPMCLTLRFIIILLILSKYLPGAALGDQGINTEAAPTPADNPCANMPAGNSLATSKDRKDARLVARENK